MSTVETDSQTGHTPLETDATDGPRDTSILRHFRDLSVRSKFLIMMLLTGLLSMGIVSLISYKVGRDALVNEVFNKLTSLSASNKQQLEQYFDNMKQTVAVFGENILVAQATLSFADAVKAVDNTPASKEQIERLKAYYRTEFFPRLAERKPQRPTLDEYLPKSKRALSLQSYMIADNPNPPGEKGTMVVSDDFSNYGLTHEAHHRWFKTAADKHHFYDVFLIDVKTDRIIYSVAKEVDFATSLSDGPYAQSNLARLYRSVKSNPKRGKVDLIDYEEYVPTYTDPAGFLATPIFSGRRFVGVLAAQFSVEAVNNFMNRNEKWRELGMGESGETYVVGQDRMMRSNSRFLIEDFDRFERDLKRNGVSSAFIDTLKERKSTVLAMPAGTWGAEQALRGESGTRIFEDYRGISVLSSYTPVDVPGLNWVLLSEMDEDEAMKPQRDFQRLLMLAAAGVTLLITLGSLILSRLFLRPVNTLVAGIERLRAGQTDVQGEKTSDDEFGELTDAFNTMSQEIRRRDETIAGKSMAYERLLRRIFPDTVAEQLRDGKGNTVDSFPQVSTAYIIVSGITDSLKQDGGVASYEVLNEVVEIFDAEAESLGVEKVKTIGEHYLATCGLTVPRLDHSRLIVEFIENIAEALRRYNVSTGRKLTFRAGVHADLVHAGIVGNRRFVYDVWGPSVNVARRIVYDADPGTMRITEAAVEQFGETSVFGEPVVIKTRTMGKITTRQKALDLGVSAADMQAESESLTEAAE